MSALPCWLITVSEPTHFRYIHGLGWLFCFLAPDLETAISQGALVPLNGGGYLETKFWLVLGMVLPLGCVCGKIRRVYCYPVCQQHRALPLPPPDLWPPFPTSEFGPQHQCLVLMCSAL